MDTRQLDPLTRAAKVATVLAFVSVLVPMISMPLALIAVVLSGTAAYRANRAGADKRLPLIYLSASVGLIVFVVAGTAIYGAAN